MLWPRAESGAPGGTRTPNRLIRSQMLYPLRYGRFGGQASDTLADSRALEGTRTPNLLIRSQMLYPLSYER